MYPDRPVRMSHQGCAQRGAGLPVALFVITVLSLIVATMAQLQQGSGESVSLQIQSQRAFYAAESGAQVAVKQALGSGCGAVTTTLNFTAAALQSCSASVNCPAPVDADIDGDGDDETVYTLTSKGRCGAGADRAERTVEVRVR